VSDYRDRKACNFSQRALFFPTSGESYEPARAICNRCPVRVECLDAVITWEAWARLGSRHGMAGGTTPAERTRMRRREVA
jgi:WhiB family redox-sensing transcriptional regulator